MKIIVCIILLVTVGALNSYGQSGYDTCAHLAAWEDIKPFSQDEAKQQYDSLRMYIELCANKDNNAWRAFTAIDGAVKLMSDDTTRYDTYRSWLVSVLYLNTSVPEYFCRCLGSIAATYQYGQFYPLGYLAVRNYIRTYHPECVGPADSENYAKDSLSLSQSGYDCTHLPSLDSMGLGFLLHPNAVPQTGILLNTFLVYFTTSPNPFKDNTTLTFTLNHMTYVELGIYDVLGRKVWGADHGASLEAGMHVVRINGALLPEGELYARISTGFGEVKTVKIVHKR